VIFNLQAMAIGGAAIALVAGGLGAKAGGDLTAAKLNREHAAAMKKLHDTADALTTKLGVERDQARAEVRKINEATAAQLAANQAALTADAATRAAAADRMERLLQQTSRDAKAAAERSDAAREVIKNVADQCARAGVPPDVLSVLNAIIDPPQAGLRDRAMPASQGHDRP
jgi:delta 1-pyrroline-5-carboxylate dehydrogenase